MRISHYVRTLGGDLVKDSWSVELSDEQYLAACKALSETGTRYSVFDALRNTGVPVRGRQPREIPYPASQSATAIMSNPGLHICRGVV